MSHGHHGQRWKFTSFSIQKVARPSGTNLQLAAEMSEFAQVPSLSTGARGTLMCLNLTFMNLYCGTGILIR